MEFNDFLNGYLKSGGWRFGGKPTSTETFQNLYTPEAYNGGLLDQVGNPNKKGPVTAAVSAAPVSTAVTTGLLGGGRDFDRTGGPHGNGTNLSDKDWGTVKDIRDAYGGLNNPFDTQSAKQAGMAMANPLATIAERIAAAFKGTPVKDPAMETLRGFQSFVDGQGRANFDLGVGANGYLSSLGINSSGALPTTTKAEVNAIIDSIISGGSGGGGFDGTNWGGGVTGGSIGGEGVSVGSAAGNGGNNDVETGAWNGGLMTPDRVHGPKPDNPDDGYTSIQVGEYVVKKSAVDKLGKKTLDNINKGILKKG